MLTELNAVARDNPEILEVMATVLPTELAVPVEQRTPVDLQPHEFAALRSLLDVINACKMPGDPQQVFSMIEEGLRARMAVHVIDQAGTTGRQK